MALIGEKFSIVLLVFGIWGVVMLMMLGVFARVNSVALSDDIPFDEAKWVAMKHSPSYINGQFNMVSTNCFVAALFYGGITVFAGIQYKLNLRSSYLLS